MTLEEKAQEILETLWIRSKEAGRELLSVAEVGGEEDGAVRQLLEAGLVALRDDQLRLTEEGVPEATSIVRRHRLAERLLADVLDTGGVLLHERACRFEHLLDRGLDDAICTLLGHPRVCPHGSSIPPGRCCLEREEKVQPVVAPLSELNPGQGGKIAYIYAPEAGKLQKLMSMGILPGAPIELMQRFPSYVFQVRHTQFAVDRELADAIYVRLVASEMPAQAKGKGGGWGWRLRHRLGWRRRT
ncbi:MAG TPA: metal-dependent transcriptional regulator [Dehalococcoidia bacterium]|nr:metal-dependent transcriptional regulator [Dehalococcoidia bacterium]